MTDFVQVSEFSRDMKRLHKKFNTIYTNIENFKEILEPTLPECLSGTVRISKLGRDVRVPIYKLKHFRCEALKGKSSRSGIRVIYAYEQDKDKITLIELYYHNKKITNTTLKSSVNVSVETREGN